MIIIRYLEPHICFRKDRLLHKKNNQKRMRESDRKRTKKMQNRQRSKKGFESKNKTKMRLISNRRSYWIPFSSYLFCFCPAKLKGNLAIVPQTQSRYFRRSFKSIY